MCDNDWCVLVHVSKFDLKTFEYCIERVYYAANSYDVVTSNAVVKCHMPAILSAFACILL
jgi:hypothetical protein